MVDPNRKINRLTDKDIEFLEECEREYALRYTEDDVEFMQHCSKPLDDPPIIENWNTGDFSRNDGGGRNFSRNDGGGRHFNRGGNRNHRNWRGNFRNRRGGRDGFVDRNRPYNRNDYGKPAFNQQQDNSSHPPMNIRRDYNNFVAASKDD